MYRNPEVWNTLSTWGVTALTRGSLPRFTVGDEVKVEIDAARRMLNARVHSAGHLLDSAFTHIGVTDLIPEKVILFSNMYHHKATK